jgi:hypothetical protein
MGIYTRCVIPFRIAFQGENPETHALQDLQANNLVNPIPLLGLEFFAKMDILEVVLRAVLRHKKIN